MPQQSHDDEIAGFGPRQLQHSLGWSFILGMQDVAVDAKFPGDPPAPVENLRGAAGSGTWQTMSGQTASGPNHDVNMSTLQHTAARV